MATGSGKTIAAITAIYRLIRYVLGEQAEKEFQAIARPRATSFHGALQRPATDVEHRVVTNVQDKCSTDKLRQSGFGNRPSIGCGAEAGAMREQRDVNAR